MNTIKEQLFTQEKVVQEIKFNQKENYQLGSYLYMGMAYKGGKKVCISVGYTLSYCIKKAEEFLSLDSDCVFSNVSKIKIGEKIACEKYYTNQALIHS